MEENQMLFVTTETDINGTSLQGEFTATRAEIEAVFGQPTYSTQDEWEKVTTEWDITFSDGTVATIYDWKRYEEGAPKMYESYSWHIGGRTHYAVDAVLSTMKEEIDITP
jgi:hypothetical protein